ncbi:MAG: hypothetical protein QOJ86_3171 [Bradyrhizobium sp.]|jgi:hypothetical protein|nr:hypothetical protein [Bradyrhizobium sp.]
MRFSFHLTRRLANLALYVGFAACFLASCSEVQMGYNVLTYDTAIADTSNQLLLLNAVRASQRYPRSFTSVGAIQASPPISGSLASTLTFSALSGLQGYTLNPSVQASGGYSLFALGNLNARAFMIEMRKEVNKDVTKSFYDNSSWPRQLLDLVYLQSFLPSEHLVRFVHSARKSACESSSPPRQCRKIAEQIDEFSARCQKKDGEMNEHFTSLDVRIRDFRGNTKMYYNTAVNYCRYNLFRIFLEEIRLAGLKPCIEQPGPQCVMARQRSPLDMIGYLGELIAAQNYIEQPFLPLMLFGRSTDTDFEFVDVPLFVVQRGEPPGGAAVAVRHDGANWYIPRPAFGSREEARSLQTLELVLQTVHAATTPEDLPKTVPAVSVIK